MEKEFKKLTKGCGRLYVGIICSDIRALCNICEAKILGYKIGLEDGKRI